MIFNGRQYYRKAISGDDDFSKHNEKEIIYGENVLLKKR